MNGSKEVISRIQDAIAASSKAFEFLHNQEHLWELEGYESLEDWFDDANKDMWKKVHHRLLKRLYKIGGSPEGVSSDPRVAFTKALSLLQSIHEACQAVYAVAEEDGDYVTSDKLSRVQAEIESWMVKAEKALAQVKRLSPSAPDTPFMSEQL